MQINKRTKNGFTLLEILVAVSVTSIILVTIATVLISGIRIWNKVLEIQLEKSPPEILEMHLRNDLNATANKNLFKEFYGTPYELKFCRFVEENDMIQIAIVEYIYDSDAQVLSYTKSIVPKSDETEIEILDSMELDIDNLSFTYLLYNKSNEEFIWSEAESVVTNLPTLIQMNFSVKLQADDEPILRSVNVK
jgi:prepilin-type N-terminal cleavage/methylation domain-containing protein